MHTREIAVLIECGLHSFDGSVAATRAPVDIKIVFPIIRISHARHCPPVGKRKREQGGVSKGRVTLQRRELLRIHEISRVTSSSHRNIPSAVV